MYRQCRFMLSCVHKLHQARAEHREETVQTTAVHASRQCKPVPLCLISTYFACRCGTGTVSARQVAICSPLNGHAHVLDMVFHDEITAASRHTCSPSNTFAFCTASKIAVLHVSCWACMYMVTLDELRAVITICNISALFSDLICLLGVSQSL